MERHAEATAVQVGLTSRGDKLMVVVEDNGKGMRLKGDSANRSLEAGLGLRGMDERTKLLKGMLVTTSGPGVGTKIASDCRPSLRRLARGRVSLGAARCT